MTNEERYRAALVRIANRESSPWNIAADALDADEPVAFPVDRDPPHPGRRSSLYPPHNGCQCEVCGDTL